ncbi:MAG: HypC/HybG/HupF family hydrogenase formation chaperone [Candidatus Sabulitectum sp.]|nr:HypC/HybG/HupF family hydrogenase formation chaperone [Candidatus Sabulitectum sp.]
MCLAVPMKIIEIKENGTGVCELENIRYDVDLSLLETTQMDDYVIVHAGFAIEKLDIEEANERLQLFQELAKTYSGVEKI